MWQYLYEGHIKHSTKIATDSMYLVITEHCKKDDDELKEMLTLIVL